MTIPWRQAAVERSVGEMNFNCLIHSIVMKRVIYSLTAFLLLSSVSCQKEEPLTFTESVARITKVVETGVSRNKGEDADEYPYRISYDLDATLSDVAGVEEWGVYFVDPDDNPIEFSFKNISTKETMHLYLNTVPKALHVGESISYIEVNRRMGLYIRMKGKKADLKTYYGDLTTYKIRFEFPSTPSVEYSNPQITSHEVVKNEEEGEGPTATRRRYRTVYSYDLTVSGSFWIDHLEDVLGSGWGWDEESNYSLSDGKHTRSATMTYSSGPVDLSQWTVIHCLDKEKTVESKNWLNITGKSYIEKVVVSDTERTI